MFGGRRRATAPPQRPLTEAQRTNLLHPWCYDAFATDAERRAAWEAHRTELMAATKPGVRPLAWWDYDRGAVVPWFRQALALDAMGELTAAELALLEPTWRASEQRAYEAWVKHARGVARSYFMRVRDVPRRLWREIPGATDGDRAAGRYPDDPRRMLFFEDEYQLPMAERLRASAEGKRNV
jgi:hypothetical protein